MGLRKTISQGELREKLEQRGEANRHTTVYRPSRGGYYPPKQDSKNKR